MITKVTKDNNGLYKALFDSASIDLKDGAETIEDVNENELIQSLDAYFQNLNELATDADIENNLYKMLPLDEPTFDIDANTRVINVPADFKKNGIAVKGDQAAEIIWFTVDRFFDVTDLNSAEIVIQWETTVNKQSVTGVSKAYCKDIKVLASQNKLTFAWIINNTIAQAAGNIKFAVRFYKLGTDGNLAFSLSTLNATATINQGLDFTLDPTSGSFIANGSFDDSNLIVQRYQWENDSAIPSTAVQPVFDVAIINHPDDCVEDVEGIHIVDLNDEGKYIFAVRASSSDGGNVTYNWTKTDLVTSNIENLDATEVWVAVDDDDIFEANTAYYIDNTLGKVPFTVSAGVSITDETKVSDVNGGDTLYVKNSTITATAIGDYKVTAINHNGVVPGKLASDTVRIPGPAAFALGGMESKVILDEDGEATLAALATKSNTHDSLVYTWTKDDSEVSATAADPSKVDIEVGEDDLAAYDSTFKVSVKATRNNASTAVQEFSFRVTDAAHKIEGAVLVPEVVKGVTKSFSINFGTSLDDIVCDTIKYQWFRIRGAEDQDPERDATDEADIAVTEVIEVAKANIASIKYTPVDTGSFYCKLINVVNGSSSEASFTDDQPASV